MKTLLRREFPLRTGLTIAALVLIATVVVARDKPEAEQPAPALEPGAASSAAESAADLEVAKLSRPAAQSPIGDLFAMRDPAPKKPVRRTVKAAPVQLAPSEPPLPFTYLGQVEDDGKLAVFLAQGSENISAAQGQVINQTYRVDQIGENMVVFTYLPSGAQQFLSIPVSN
jgi:hypothetical protein